MYYEIQKDLIYNESFDSLYCFYRREVKSRISSPIVGLAVGIKFFEQRIMTALDNALSGILALSPDRFSIAMNNGVNAFTFSIVVVAIGVLGFIAPKKALDVSVKVDAYFGYMKDDLKYLGYFPPVSASIFSPIRGVILGIDSLVNFPYQVVISIFAEDTFKRLDHAIGDLAEIVMYPLVGVLGILSSKARSKIGVYPKPVEIGFQEYGESIYL